MALSLLLTRAIDVGLMPLSTCTTLKFISSPVDLPLSLQVRKDLGLMDRGDNIAWVELYYELFNQQIDPIAQVKFHASKCLLG